MIRRNFIFISVALLAAGLFAIAATYWRVSTEVSRHDYGVEYGVTPNPESPTNSDTSVLADRSVKPCPNFEAPTPEKYGEGWKVYARPELCFSIAYPPGWGFNEDAFGVDIRRIENLKTTTYDPNTFFAVVGVTRLPTLEALVGPDRAGAEGAIAAGKDYCMSIDATGLPFKDCYRKGPSGNLFDVSVGTNVRGDDSDLAERIAATAAVW